jgi:hypothetical protein
LVDAGKLPRQRPTWLNTDSAQEPWAL